MLVKISGLVTMYVEGAPPEPCWLHWMGTSEDRQDETVASMILMLPFEAL